MKRGVMAGRGKTKRSQTVGVIHRFESSFACLRVRAGAEIVLARTSAEMGFPGGSGRGCLASRAKGEKRSLGAVRPVGTEEVVGTRMPETLGDGTESGGWSPVGRGRWGNDRTGRVVGNRYVLTPSACALAGVRGACR